MFCFWVHGISQAWGKYCVAWYTSGVYVQDSKSLWRSHGPQKIKYKRAEEHWLPILVPLTHSPRDPISHQDGHGGIKVKGHSSQQDTQVVTGKEESLVRARLEASISHCTSMTLQCSSSNLPWARLAWRRPKLSEWLVCQLLHCRICASHHNGTKSSRS